MSYGTSIFYPNAVMKNTLYTVGTALLTFLVGSFILFTVKAKEIQFQLDQRLERKRTEFTEQGEIMKAELESQFPGISGIFDSTFSVDDARILQDTGFSLFLYNKWLSKGHYDETYISCVEDHCVNISREVEILHELDGLLDRLARGYTELEVYDLAQEVGWDNLLHSEFDSSCSEYFETKYYSGFKPGADRELERFLVQTRRERRRSEWHNTKEQSAYDRFISENRNALHPQGRLELDELLQIRSYLTENTDYATFSSSIIGEHLIETTKLQFEQSSLSSALEELYDDKYRSNSLRTGAKPYAACFGYSNSCSGYNCSEIKVETPSSSDVIVSIKKNGTVYRHAYIQSSSSYTFHIPDGLYQVFFYYGNGWNPRKVALSNDQCGQLMGAFVEDSHFGKDDPVYMDNEILTYTLILQRNGNLKEQPSSMDEAF